MLLRTVNVGLGCLLVLYWTLFLLCPYFREGPKICDFENDRVGASVCPSINTVPAGFFTREFSVNQGRDVVQSTSSKRLGFWHGIRSVCVFILLLSGDVELNPGPHSNCLRFAQFNSRSVIGKPSDDKPTLIQNFITDQSIDILAITETWLKPNSLPATINSITPEGYTCMHVPRAEGQGGGVAFIYRSCLEFRQITFQAFGSFEYLAAKLVLNSSSFLFMNFYRSPSLSESAFIRDFSCVLESVATMGNDFFLCGDFNFRMDTHEYYPEQFRSVLQDFGMKQLVDFSTHASGHLLDLLITPEIIRSKVSNIWPTYLTFSDHLAVSCDIELPNFTRPAKASKRVRVFKLFDPLSFTKDLFDSGLNFISSVDLDLYVNAFTSTIGSLLDKHAPWKTVKYSQKQDQPFYDGELRAQKQLRSRLESKWRVDKNESNFVVYKAQAKYYAGLLRSTRRKFYRSLVQKYSDNSRKLWATINKVIGNSKVKVLPTSLSEASLAKSFSDFFIGKVQKLSDKLNQNSTTENVSSDELMDPPPQLLQFEETSEREVRQTILSMTDATCILDVLPTRKLKDCLDGLIKPITTIVNKCLIEGRFPTKFKHAVVLPTLKKLNLPKEELSSYRPVSNLNFISKVVEKIIQNRLLKHINSFSGLPNFQSAYRMFHSTETALLRVQNDLLLAIEQRKVSALTLLDLSAAFDTVDHVILAERLHSFFGLSGTALSLLSSYLSNRTQSILIGDELSSPVTLTTGVPQGSILGPLLFSLYTAPLEHLLKKKGVSFHFYADDTQIYMSFSASDSLESLARFSDVLTVVKEWFSSSKLSLNADKTEFIIVGTKQQRAKAEGDTLKLNFDNCSISPSESVRNLGVIFDSDMSMSTHVSKICQLSFLHLRNFRRIRGILDLNSAKLVANALVSCRLDYCNSLLYGIDKGLLNKLQRVQNALARVVVTSVRRHDHVSPALKQLHWLPVEQRILYKVGLLAFKVKTNGQPLYLAEMLHCAPSSNRRSSCKNLLTIPFLKSENGRRSFCFSAPTVWNSLPQELRDVSTEDLFRKKLKTFLFPK